MKKKIFAALLGAFALFGVGFGLTVRNFANFTPVAVLAEGEETSEETSEEEVKICTVSIEKSKHGTIEADIFEGEIGDIVTLQVSPSLGYLIEGVKVNGTALIESEEISGQFMFALVEGENKVSATFIVDEELFGAFAKMYSEAMDKDWTRLFSVENLITIVKWFLDGGVLIMLARYYIKDKKLEKNVEKNITENMNKIIPDVTKTTVIATIKNVVEPMFVNMQSEMIDMANAMSVFAKCFALGQENTPEARLAILQALQGLKISDQNILESTKAYIEDLVKRSEKTYQDTMAALTNIESNKKEAEAQKEMFVPEGTEPKENNDNGTQI